MTYDVVEWKGFPNSPEVVMLFFQPEYKFKFSCFQNFLLSIVGCSIATIAFFISAPASRPLTPPVLPCSRPPVSFHCVVHDSSHSEHKIRFVLSLFEAIFLHVRFYFFCKIKILNRKRNNLKTWMFRFSSASKCGLNDWIELWRIPYSQFPSSRE